MAGHARLKQGIFGLMAALLLAFGQVAIGGVAPVSAHDDCQNQGSTNGSPWTCGYTQMDPNDWPWDGSAPQCGSTCWAWWMPNGSSGDVPADFSGIGNGNNVKFYDDLINAMYDWAGQPYNSPMMYEDTGCSCTEVHDGWKDEGGWSNNTTTCAFTSIWQTSGNNIEQVTIMYNSDSQVEWWDGQPTSRGV